MIEIKVLPVGEVVVVGVNGRLDSMTAPQLENEINQIQDSKAIKIALDFSQVDYMSAAGLRVLKNLYDRMGVVVIAMPSRRVREVLQITGLDTTYNLFETRLETIHHCAPVTNAHTHLELGWLANYCPDVAGAPFFDWITGLIGRRIALGNRLAEVCNRAIEQGIKSLIDCGTTVVGDISGTGLSVEPLFNSGLHGIIYLEVIGTDFERARETLVWAQSVITQWRSKENKMRLGISLHTPYSVHPDLWQPALDYVRKENLPLCIHVAESAAERQHLLLGTSPEMDAFYARTGSVRFAPPMKTPVAYLEDLGALALRPLLAHAVEVDDDDLRRIKRSGSAVVHCPRSNLRLRCNRMPLEKFIEHEIPVYVGTDGLCSAPSLNVFDDLEIAVALHHGRVQPDTIKKLVHQLLPA